MKIRPIDIAKKLNISTSTLRHYETWGIVPPPDRKPNGYRIYTDVHQAYFECIRAMFPGFGVPVTSKVMRMLQNEAVDDALWIVNEAQASLHRDKMIAEKTIRILETPEFNHLDVRGKTKWMTIGEVSKETAVPSSAIRHWEKMDLISPSRDPESGYRRFNSTQVRQVMIIRTLRTAVYSLDVIKEIIKEFDHHNIEQARKFAQNSISYLNKINRDQLRGAHYLHLLCRKLNLLDDIWEHSYPLLQDLHHER